VLVDLVIVEYASIEIRAFLELVDRCDYGAVDAGRMVKPGKELEPRCRTTDPNRRPVAASVKTKRFNDRAQSECSGQLTPERTEQQSK
jgi:hypothetical protein